MFVHSFPKKSVKRLARDVFDFSVRQTNFIHDISDTDSSAQNGSSHGAVFSTFKDQFF